MGFWQVSPVFHSIFRHEKKVLALVLAFACAFTMFAGAAFTDEADIQANDAVNMLTALGVIEGYEDGSFQPDGVVTRAEMAKMIFVVRNNSIDDSAYANTASKLTDIDSHWAKGYIKFCESQGIIAGKGNGIFDPDATVTGTEAAKMLLVLAGYEPSKAGLEGTNWATNTLKYAGAAGILDDVASGLESGLPRQYAAQMIYNTLSANRVKWSTDSESFDDNLGNGYKETVGYAYMDLCSDTGVLVSIDKDAMDIVISKADDSDNYHKYADGNIISFTKVGTDYSSLLGQKVKVMFKDGKTNNVLGVYAVADNSVVTANQKDVDVDAGKLKINDTKYTLETNGVNVYIDGEKQADEYKASDFKDAQSTAVLTFIDSDSNNKIDTACVSTITVAKVTYVSSTQIIAGGKTYKFDEDTIASDLARDDRVLVTRNLYNDNYDVVKADVQTGTVNSTKNAGSYTQYEIDGEWYNAAATGVADINGNVKPGAKIEYVAVNGILCYAKRTTGTASLDDILFVSYVGTNGLNDDQAKVMFPDGSTATITLAETKTDDDFDGEYDDTVIDNTNASGKFFEYTKASNGYKLAAIRTEAADSGYYGDYTHVDDTSSALQMKDSSNTQTGKVDTLNGVKIDDNADVIIFSENSITPYKSAVKHITGKQLKNLPLGSGSDQLVNKAIDAFTSDVNGLTRVTVLAVQWTDSRVGTLDHMNAGGNYANYGFMLSDARDLGDTIGFTLWTTEGEKEVVADKGNTTGFSEGTIVGYASIETDENGNNIIKDCDPISNGSGKVNKDYIKSTNGSDTIQLGSTGKEIELDDYTTVLYVNSNDGTGDVDGKPVKANEVVVNGSTAGYATNVLISNGTTEFVIIDSVEFKASQYSQFSLNQPGSMTGLNSVEYVNIRTSETDTQAFDNAIVELRVNAKEDGTMTLTNAQNVEDANSTLTIKAGWNTFRIWVYGSVTPTFTPSNVTPPVDSDIVVVVGAPSGDLTYKASDNFTVNVSAMNAFGKEITVESIKKDNAGSDVKGNFTIGTDTPFVNNDGETKTLTITEKGSALPGSYTASVKVGDSESKTFTFTVKAAKIAAAPSLDLSSIAVNLSVGQTPAVAAGTSATVSGSVTGVNNAGATYSVIESTNKTTANTVEVDDVWQIVVKIPAQAGYEFTDPTTVGSLTNVNLTKDGSTTLGTAAATLEDSNTTLVLTYTVTIVA